MKRNLLTIACHCFLFASSALFVSSCKKDETPTAAPRIFKPSEIKVVASESSAWLSWKAPLFTGDNPYSYTVDFSTDSLFSTTEFSGKTDSAGFTVKEGELKLRLKYFARIKANATATQPESKYMLSSGFKIVGKQLFRADKITVRDNSVDLGFLEVPAGSKIVLTPETGTAITVTLGTADLAKKSVTIPGLMASTKYTAELFSGTSSNGYLTFTTSAPVVYTVKITPADNLAGIIATAADNAVIGLEDGTYELPALVNLAGKMITLRSVNDNPEKVKVNGKGFTLTGTGAGLSFSGINFDGTAYSSLYFCDLISSGTGVASTFKNVRFENSWIHGISTAIVRADRNTLFVMNELEINRCKIYDISGTSYYLFHLDKLAFKSLKITKSTIYNSSPGLVNCKTTMAGAAPEVSISECSINNIGFAGMYTLIIAAANPVTFSMKNSIIANAPRSGTVAGLTSITSGASVTTFEYNNTFNLKTSNTNGTDLPLPAGAKLGQTVDPGWNANTTQFTLPAGSVLLKSNSSGGQVGDPRWAL
ncbi:DUF4957 domain-containing protein [Pedobacter sp. PLR]|uniref:DUF4957 domain-containing protein n=1 Tax=Pedobacter sp. PLR TaxID=2994465 RepID=UPI00224559F3|nr:DUF4957 domain-containing protein [Pedobacter sp. PLR]MCX2453984.1 DUF4957 domain-containing protein [Pedobacter sp. PLR]